RTITQSVRLWDPGVMAGWGRSAERVVELSPDGGRPPLEIVAAHESGRPPRFGPAGGTQASQAVRVVEDDAGADVSRGACRHAPGLEEPQRVGRVLGDRSAAAPRGPDDEPGQARVVA